MSPGLVVSTEESQRRMDAYTLGLQDWGRKVTAEGVVFYVRRGTGDTRWGTNTGVSAFCISHWSF